MHLSIRFRHKAVSPSSGEEIRVSDCAGATGEPQRREGEAPLSPGWKSCWKKSLLLSLFRGRGFSKGHFWIGCFSGEMVLFNAMLSVLVKKRSPSWPLPHGSGF